MASEATDGTFQFLGIRREYGDRVRWTDPRVPRLWRFHLNSFGWAWAIATAQPAGGGRSLAALIEDFRVADPPRRGDPWHPFVAAERLLNLLGTRALWLPHLKDPGRVEKWVWHHARFVEASLERDVGGNHLIRETASLVAAGTAFGSVRLRDRALGLFAGALRRQILADGGHEERSPSYHLEVLMDVAEVRALLPAEHPFRRSLDSVLGRMADFAASMCHPNGQLAMFNDCSAWPAPPDEFLRSLGLDPQPAHRFPDSGYHVMGEGGDRLFFDAGPPSPRDLPPHAHCDLLSIEVSAGGRRMIVNSGTGDYARGEWRDYWRSTRAHNTVEVDGAEQSEVWHSFRMARRASPLDVSILRSPDWSAVVAAHDGYRRLRPPATHRRLVARSSGGWAVVDVLEGSGRHSVRSFLHLEPGIVPSHAEGLWLLESEGATLRVCSLGDLTITLQSARTGPIENWVASRLGERERGRSLVMQGSGQAPMLFGWVLAPGLGPLTASIEGSPSSYRVRIRDGNEERILDLSSMTRALGSEG